GEVVWRVLWPDGAPPGGGPNDASVVVWLGTPSVSVLALGDLETETQDALARDLAARGVRSPARFVVMAHHGSARQSAALAALLDPEVLLVGVGEDNDYGHPAPSALALYPRATVLRTDECGPVALTPTHHTPC
ncbi:MAG: MBL fold metallo-hydrolase, partial [Actinomycetales bacterium]|nr:MBL fold metallo-hydrolase [Actinomycetales bacterium]